MIIFVWQSTTIVAAVAAAVVACPHTHLPDFPTLQNVLSPTDRMNTEFLVTVVIAVLVMVTYKRVRHAAIS